MRRTALFLPLLALYALVTLRSGSPLPVQDEGAYLGFAHRLGEGHYAAASGDVDYLWYGPGLPLPLAPLVALHASLNLLRLVEGVFLFGAVLSFDRLLQLVASKRVAMLGAYALGLYPAFSVTLLQHTFSEPLAVLSATFGLLFMALAMRTGAARHLALSGLGFGWLALTRVGFGWVLTILLVMFVVIWLVRRWRGTDNAFIAQRAAAICALALAVCVPWLAYTYSVTHRPFYWGNSGGLNLYWMASPYPGDLGDWQGPTSDDPHHEPFFRSLRGLGPVAKDTRLQSRALDLIREHPAGYLENLPPNVSRLFLQTPFTHTSSTLVRRAAYAVPNLLILGLLALCLPALLRARGRLSAETLPFAMFAGVGVAFHSLLAAEGRMLVPMLPVLLWLVLYAVAVLDALRLPTAVREVMGIATARHGGA